nr:molybdopterin-dependent oxidoreductase [Bacillus sp. B15-48]
MGIESGVGGNPLKIREASIIIISGANPAATNIHLIPFIIEAKVKGAKVVVIDPLYTQTAELVDLFIQVRPGGDGILAGLLLKRLLEAEVVAGGFVDGKDHLCPKNFYG